MQHNVMAPVKTVVFTSYYEGSGANSYDLLSVVMVGMHNTDILFTYLNTP
jgi:hypothetical protein